MISRSGRVALNEHATSTPAHSTSARKLRVPGSAATWRAALLFAAITIVLAYPLSIHPVGLRFPTGPDGDLGWYILGWNAQAFLHRPWAIFDANIYYPDHLTLAYGENLIGVALFTAPVIWLGGNLLLAANFGSLFSTAACGLAAYILARRLQISVAGAVICGIIFLASPPKFFRIGQLPLSSLQWIPLTLAALHAYFEHGRRRDIRLAALFISLQVLSSGHGAVFVAVTVTFFGLYRFVLGEPIRLFTRIRDLGVTGALLLAPSILAFLPYRIVQREVGLQRGLGSWVANNQSFLASPSHLHKYLIDGFGLSHINATAAAFLFPGYLPFVLAGIALVWPMRRVFRERHAAWSKIVASLEAALVIGSAVASLLTLAAVITVSAGTTTLAEPAAAERLWLVSALIALIGAALVRFLPAETLTRHRRGIIALLLVGGTWVALTEARSTMRAGNGLRAEYFANAEWQPPARISTADARFSADAMRHRWGGLPPDQFSARWTGFLTVERAGTYFFRTTSDDGSRLFVDRALVVDNSGVHPPATESGSIRLDAGSHLVVLEYSQAGVGSELEWTWSRDGSHYSGVPGWALSQRQTHYSSAVIARAVDLAIAGTAILALCIAVWYSREVLSGRWELLAGWMARRRRDATLFYGLLTLGAVWLALGPPFGLWQYVYWWPGFNFIRVNTRFTLLALLGLAVLAGIGFDQLGARLRPKLRVFLAGAVGVLLVVEFAAMPLASQPSNFEIPAVDRWLNTQPKPFVVAEVPVHDINDLGRFERQEVTYMIHSTAHWQKTVHGYSGWRTDFHRELYVGMRRFPDKLSLDSLSNLGVTYVVVHTDNYPPAEWKDVEARLRTFSSRLTLIHEEGAGRVYRLAGGR